MAKRKSPWLWLGWGTGLGAALATFMTGWRVGRAIIAADQTLRALPPPGRSFSEQQQHAAYTLIHVVEDGIERITYTPNVRRFETPILMQHGMWHGAWCWQFWQAWLAEWGWESTAISLPGHGRSPERRPVMLCTLEYYLGFLKAELERLPRKPILMGHSMGGALTQHYLKDVGDDLPAAVMVAPWNAFDVFADSMPHMLRLDPLGFLASVFSLTATPAVRSPQAASRLLLSPNSLYTPVQFQAHLGPESALILFEHRKPHWTPPAKLHTPTLLLAGERDAIVTLAGLRQSAAHFGADFVSIPDAGHNLMHAHNAHQTAGLIHNWLSARTA
ncbi:MAG: alpha/beta hydrolase [Chloroflexota bacterium]